MTRRFFLAHPKSDRAETIAERLVLAHAVVSKVAAGRPFTIVAGRDYFEERFKAAGSWEAWAYEVAAGVSYQTREPLFDVILVPSFTCGAGTAKILQMALSARKPCFVFDGQARVARILAARRVDAGDWKTGWRVLIGPWRE